MAGLGTHVAIERAALVTPSLKSGAPRSYPNTFSPREKAISCGHRPWSRSRTRRSPLHFKRAGVVRDFSLGEKVPKADEGTDEVLRSSP